jgi:hypothetical protein
MCMNSTWTPCKPHDSLEHLLKLLAVDNRPGLERHAPALAATLAAVNRGEPADAEAAVRARVRQHGVGVGAHGEVAAAVADVALDTVAVLDTHKVLGDVLAGLQLVGKGFGLGDGGERESEDGVETHGDGCGMCLRNDCCCCDSVNCELQRIFGIQAAVGPGFIV